MATHAGRFEEALSHFVWFHEHALEEDPAFTGVRLSFALAYWLDLARQYPPALAAFRTCRDAKLKEIHGGEFRRELFHDIEAMSERLGEDHKTADLFASLDNEHPEFAQSCANVAIPALVRTSRFSLAAKYLPSPESRAVALADELTRDVGDISARPRSKTPLYCALVHNFSDDLLMIESILNGMGRGSQAAHLRENALSHVKPAYLRNAVVKHLANEA